jgi:soluble lytic murein transglycosylase-like protein
MRQLLSILVIFAFWAAAGSARANLYEFIDDAGVRHYSTFAYDGRYKLIQRIPKARSPVRRAEQSRPVPGVVNYASLIEDEARSHGLDPVLLQALIRVESGFNPAAVSPKGAMGLMQLMPATAKRYGVGDALDPLQNIRGGTKYLKDLWQMFDQDIELVLAAYNAGENAVIRHGRRIPPYQETLDYVPKVMRHYDALRKAM